MCVCSSMFVCMRAPLCLHGCAQFRLLGHIWGTNSELSNSATARWFTLRPHPPPSSIKWTQACASVFSAAEELETSPQWLKHDVKVFISGCSRNSTELQKCLGKSILCVLPHYLICKRAKLLKSCLTAHTTLLVAPPLPNTAQKSMK